jgi:hypothetical protein
MQTFSLCSCTSFFTSKGEMFAYIASTAYPGAGRRIRACGSHGHFGGHYCLTAGATTDYSPNSAFVWRHNARPNTAVLQCCHSTAPNRVMHPLFKIVDRGAAKLLLSNNYLGLSPKKKRKRQGYLDTPCPELPHRPSTQYWPRHMLQLLSAKIVPF